MKYELSEALSEDLEILIKFKLDTIMTYGTNLSEEEIEKIINYVNKKVPEQLNLYKMILVDNKKVGCFLIYDYKDGKLIDEIYLLPEYRSLGIGTNLLKKYLDGKNLYLWVYKENKRAISLYKKLGFFIVEETETRFFMRHEYKS